MGKVILGLPGPWADDNFEPGDPYTSKIGGLPDWPLPKEAIKHKLLECGACGSKLSLIAQVYAPISSGNVKIEDRQLYVLGCVMSNCGTSALSWQVLRIQSSCRSNGIDSTIRDTILSDSSSANTNWLENLDEGDEEGMDFELMGQALSEAGYLASNRNKKKRNQPSEVFVTSSSSSPRVRLVEDFVTSSSSSPRTRLVEAETPAVLPCFYIYTQEEPSSKDIGSICSNYSLFSIKEKQSDCNVEEEAWESENYEYDRALTADRTYLKFKKRLDACPEQCYRYSYGGRPLLAAARLGDPGSCSLCGASRQFEMQLMPPLIYFLQDTPDDGQKHKLENWNWMTLLVYTCSKSCCPSLAEDQSSSGDWLVAEEAIILQED